MANNEQMKKSDDQTKEPEQSEGLFQRWFPGWTGWYGSYGSNEPQVMEEANLTKRDASATEDQNFGRYNLLLEVFI